LQSPCTHISQSKKFVQFVPVPPVAVTEINTGVFRHKFVEILCTIRVELWDVLMRAWPHWHIASVRCRRVTLVLERQQGVVVPKGLRKQWIVVTDFLLVFIKRILSEINYIYVHTYILSSCSTLRSQRGQQP